MTASQIFKMELFKYVRDKTYILATGILAIINIFVTIYFTYVIDNYTQNSGLFNDYFFGFMIVFLVLTIIANTIFMFLYPFHLVSMDYKNNVMSMLVSSGVNRTQLFFAKIGAMFLWNIILTFILVFIPFALIFFKILQVADIQSIFSGFMAGINMAGYSFLGMIASSFVSYINSLVIIATATIILKGNNLTFFLFIGLGMLQSAVTSLLSFIPLALNFSTTGIMIMNNLIVVVMTLMFVLISLQFMKTQNL
ncbi:ABC transporter permease [Vagococcus sp. JNUCC 83]